MEFRTLWNLPAILIHTVPDAKPLSTNGVSGLPIGSYNPAGSYLEVEYLRRKGATATNLTYTVQFAKTPTGATWLLMFLP